MQTARFVLIIIIGLISMRNAICAFFSFQSALWHFERRAFTILTAHFEWILYKWQENQPHIRNRIYRPCNYRILWKGVLIWCVSCCWEITVFCTPLINENCWREFTAVKWKEKKLVIYVTVQVFGCIVCEILAPVCVCIIFGLLIEQEEILARTTQQQQSTAELDFVIRLFLSIGFLCVSVCVCVRSRTEFVLCRTTPECCRFQFSFYVGGQVRFYCFQVDTFQ